MTRLSVFYLALGFVLSGLVASAEPRKFSGLGVRCHQVVLVVSADWGSPSGKLTGFAKRNGIWNREIQNVPVTLGRNGLGVGLGLHSTDLKGPEKREGDKRAPAGIFPIEFSFGRKAKPSGNDPYFPYHKAGRSHFWVDDPKSAFYNRWVDLRDPMIRKDWSSAEVLARPDGIYDLAIVVGHNRERFLPGKGSAIFMHRWSAPGRATIGCTAMSEESLKRLWAWLDGDLAPVLIQAPSEILPQLPIPTGVAELVIPVVP